MNTLESLLNEIVQDMARSTTSLQENVNESRDLLNEALKNGSEEEREAAYARAEEAKKAYAEALENCTREISNKYSSSLVEAVKLANSEGGDTNPIYSGEIEKYRGMSILHLAAYGFFGDKIEEMLPYFRPQDIKRGSGLKLESELMAAIEEKNIVLRDWLLKNDPDLMYQKKSGSSALHIACMIKDFETTKDLIKRVTEEKGSDAVKEFVNAVNTYSCTPLFDALVMGSDEDPLDNHKMLEFLSLFIKNGVELGKENSGNFIPQHNLFNAIITSRILEDLDLAAAAVKMLNSGQDIKIDLKKSGIREFFTNESNIQKILLLEDYNVAQKILALNKIKEALNGPIDQEMITVTRTEGYRMIQSNSGEITDVMDDNDNTYNIQTAIQNIITPKLHSVVLSIEDQISKLSETPLSDIAVSEVASGIEHIDIDPNTQVEVSGHSCDEEVIEN